MLNGGQLTIGGGAATALRPAVVTAHTDGQPGTIERNDAMFGVAVEGDQRGNIQPFLSVPAGAECAALWFTPDSQTAFVSVQRPGEGGTFREPLSRWPDFDAAVPPLPSVVATWRTAEGDPTIGV
jgi:secreted PhoX family phosphatase